jgi:hypothetical protein
MKNIDQIRQLLTQAEKEAQKGLMEYDNAILGTLSQIKALLPCKTCNDTGKVPEKAKGCVCAYCHAGLDGCQISIPCPNCKGESDE